MIANYFKIALRTLLKEKVYSLINVIGLTVGVTCCLLIVFYVQDELSYDRFHENGENIYRITGSYLQGGDERNKSAITTYQLGPALKVRIPLIEKCVRMQRYTDLVQYEDKRFMEENVLYADSGFFEMFTFPFIKGNPKTALLGINTVVISEDIAQKYFGDQDPMEKFLDIEGINVEVTGVMKNMPDNSHIQADFILSLKTVENGYPQWVLTNWSGTSHYTYIQLGEKTNKETIAGQLSDFVGEYYDEETGPEYALQSIYDIHLRSELTGEMEPGGDIVYVYIFSCVALIIIIIACINFMNLATARSVDRAKEVGLRKVVGAGKKQIVLQFLSESIITSLIAFTLAGVLAELLLPFFNDLSGKSIQGALLISPSYILVLLAISIITGILSGIYPAFFLSSFQPAKVLKGAAIKVGKGNINIRKALVMLQFCISITLIIGTIIINNQISFMRNQNLGINPELLIKFPLQTSAMSQQYDAFKKVLLSNSDITDVTASSNNLTNRIGGWRPYRIAGSDERVLIPTVIVEYDFFKTLQADIKLGRDFSEERTTDLMEAYILNESAVRFLELEDPINTPILGSIFTGSDWSQKDAQVIGVVKDFHFASLHSEIQPMAFSLHNEKTMGLGFVTLRVKSVDLNSTLRFIENKWTEFAPDRPIDYSFVDEEIYHHYRAEDKFHKVFSTFSILAIGIACLGIFGLAAFTTRKRIKEIGIRKVLGASVAGVTLLLSRDVAKLVLISNIVAWPAAWYIMDRWLEDFAYKIDVSIWTFVLGMLITLSIAFITVSLQAVKAALANPVNSLRNE